MAQHRHSWGSAGRARDLCGWPQEEGGALATVLAWHVATTRRLQLPFLVLHSSTLHGSSSVALDTLLRPNGRARCPSPWSPNSPSLGSRFSCLWLVRPTRPGRPPNAPSYEPLPWRAPSAIPAIFLNPSVHCQTRRCFTPVPSRNPPLQEWLIADALSPMLLGTSSVISSISVVSTNLSVSSKIPVTSIIVTDRWPAFPLQDFSGDRQTDLRHHATRSGAAQPDNRSSSSSVLSCSYPTTVP